MIQRPPSDPRLRAERKANLLLASELLRGQLQRDADDVGGRANGLVNRVLTVRDWLSSPVVLAAAGTGAAFFAGVGRNRRGKLMGALRWAWLGWRVLRKR